MKKILLSTLILMALPLICVRNNGARACGPWTDLEGNRVWLFDPYVGMAPGLEPFRYYYYGWTEGLASGDPDITQEEELTNMWAARLEGVKVQDIDYVLFKMKSSVFLTWAIEGTLGKNLPKNTFIKALLARADLMEYLVMAFNSTQYLSYGENWNTPELDQFIGTTDGQTAPRKEDSKGDQNMGKTCLEKARSAKLDYLRYGYAYLACKNFRAANNTGACIAAFEEILNNEDAMNNGGVIYNMALRHYASALYYSDRVAEAALRFAILFDRTPSIKPTVALAMSYEELKLGLPLAATPKEKESLHALIEIRNVGRSLDGLKELAAINPESPYLGLLIGREINKLENWLLSVSFSGYFPVLYKNAADDSYWWSSDEFTKTMSGLNEADTQYGKELLLFLVSFKGATSQQAENNVIHIAAAHLAFLLNNPGAAQAELAKIVNPKPKEAFAIATLNCMNDLIGKNDEIGKLESKLFDHLMLAQKASQSITRGETIFGNLCQWVGRWYKKQGKEMEAGLLYFRSPAYSAGTEYSDVYKRIYYFDKFARPKDLERLFVLLAKKKKSAFETWLTEPIKIPAAYKDLLGTLYMREGNVAKADSVFSQVPNRYWKKTMSWGNYKYFRHVSDYDAFHQVDALLLEKGDWKFNKKGIVKKLLELEKNANDSAVKRGEALFLLGNAWYNFSQFGNNWMMLGYGWSNSPVARDDLRKDDYGFYEAIAKECLNLDRADHYYQEALKCTLDKELRAKILYMLAVIKQINHNQMPREEVENDAVALPIANPWLEILKRDYSDTELARNLNCMY